jgi:hypothetical protein
MRRVIVISLAGIALSGCASFSVPGLGFLTPAPPVATLQLESMPAGAEARTSAGPSCRTPCAVSVPAEPLTVTFTLDRFQPQTVAVQPLRQTVVNPNVDVAGVSYIVELDPNPVFAQLAPAAPPKRTTRRPPPKRVAKRPPAEAPPPAGSPFPPPASSSPFPSR